MKLVTVLGLVLTTCCGAALFAGAGSRDAGRCRSSAESSLVVQLAAARETSSALRNLSNEYGDATIGAQRFRETCAACHGANGQGMPRQGLDLRTSAFIAGRTDEKLVEFLKSGRWPNDAQSVSGLLMPPRGGNSSLDDAQLRNIVAFLRQMQREAQREAAQENSPASAARTD